MYTALGKVYHLAESGEQPPSAITSGVRKLALHTEQRLKPCHLTSLQTATILKAFSGGWGCESESKYKSGLFPHAVHSAV